MRWLGCGLVLLFVLVRVSGLGLAGNLLENPALAMGAAGPPWGWTIFSGQWGETLWLETGTVNTLELRDDSTTLSLGLRSQRVPAQADRVYRAEVMTQAQDSGTASLYLEFWNQAGQRIAFQAVHSRSEDWTPLGVEMLAPPESVAVSIILYSLQQSVGLALFHSPVLKLQEFGRVMDLRPTDEQLDYAPVDGGVVTTNPPAFVWLPMPGAVSYLLEYSTDPQFSPEVTEQVQGIDMAVYVPEQVLDPEQTWYWRVHAVNRAGVSFAGSPARAFTIAYDAVQFPLPPLDEVRAQIPGEHPRLFITPQDLPRLKESIARDALLDILWSSVYWQAGAAVFAPGPVEPPHSRPGGVFDIALWREHTHLVASLETLEKVAFAYLIGEDEELGGLIRQWLMEIASWDPAGNTSWDGNSESAMIILQLVPRIYTWGQKALSEAEREAVIQMMQARGNEVYQILRSRPFESKPYTSHPGRALGFLGEASIAFYGEIPEAKEWFDYVLRVMVSVYPAWGGDDGGWAEGHAYWNSYINRISWYLDALKIATGLDLYQKPFFQNTGYFKLYTQPPYSTIGPFGDFADAPPRASDGHLMAHLATVYENPYFRWYADQMGATTPQGWLGIIRTFYYPRMTLSQGPARLPQARYFSDIGWVALHHNFGQRNDSIQFMFKSSPYGSFSHSLADQNSFTLEAYGVPLAISSGYRPWYGSDHHMNWTKTTQAHNAILVNGRGQVTQSLSAKGEILQFIHGSTFDYILGDARQAYSRVDRALRHVVYLRPDLFLLYDELTTSEPSTFSWLLHSYHPMEIDQGRISFSALGVGLWARLWASQELAFSQTNQFAVPLDEPMNKPVQWHLTAQTREPDRNGTFLAVLHPYREGQEREIDLEYDPQGGVQIRQGEELTTIVFGAEDREIHSQRFSAQAQVVARKEKAGTVGLLLVGGSEYQDEEIHLRSSSPVTVELSLERDSQGEIWEIHGTIQVPQGPGVGDVQLEILSGYLDLDRIDSEGPALSWSLSPGRLLLILSPGEHRLRIR